jgi:NADH:ubiquinone oxidoreductase subunit 6 (subunit J)
MFELAHISIALQKAWPWFTPGLIFAYAGVITLTIFVIFSFFDMEIIRTYGRKRWRQMHLVITIALALLIILHFGLMGDHLGFLKG